MGILSKKGNKPARRTYMSNGTVRPPTRTTPEELAERYAFRRNRTLTGSLSSNVSSVNEHKAELKSSRVQAHTLRHHRRRLVVLWWVMLAGTALIGWLLYQSIALPVVKADTVRQIDQELYANKIQDYLNSRPLERYRFALNTETLSTFLQLNGCPEVQGVDTSLTFEGIGQTGITLRLRSPAVVWTVADRQVYVDSQGVSYERNYFEDPSVRVIDNSGADTTNGKVLASNNFLGFVGKVVGGMKTRDYSVVQVALPRGTTRQIEITAKDIPYKVKMTVDRRAGEQVEDADRALQHLLAKNIKAEYVDVRVSGKAFYK